MILGGVHAATNTNLLGESNMCHGMLNGDQVREAFGGTGKFSSSDGWDYSCVLRRSNLAIGDDGATIRVYLSGEGERFPFSGGHWAPSADARPSRDGNAGISSDGSWLLVPPDCDVDTEKGETSERWSVRAGGSFDESGILPILHEVRRGILETSGCASVEQPSLSSPPISQPTDAEKACSVSGFRINSDERPEPAPTLENVSGSLRDSWFCDLRLDSPESTNITTKDPFARFAVVRNESLVANLPSKVYTKLTCGGKATFVLSSTNGYAWEPGEREEHGLADASTLHDRLVDSVKELEGCTRS